MDYIGDSFGRRSATVPCSPSFASKRSRAYNFRADLADCRENPEGIQGSHLLAKGEDFNSDSVRLWKKTRAGGNQGEGEWQHGLLVLT